MRITFAIITTGEQDARVNKIIDSIEQNNIPEYQILVVGGMTSMIARTNTIHLPFDETERPGWITKKKNMATHHAVFDTVVYLHDYHAFAPDWYAGMTSFGDDWDVQMNAIKTHEGKRMLDWAILDHLFYPIYSYVPYDMTSMVPCQYISGGYWVAKRDIMLRYPLDESRVSFQEEDVEWSIRIRNTLRIVMNPGSVVHHLKVHRDAWRAKERSLPFGVPYE